MKYLILAIFLIAGCENVASVNNDNFNNPDKDFKFFVYGRFASDIYAIYQNGEHIGTTNGLDTVGVKCYWGQVKIDKGGSNIYFEPKPYALYELNNNYVKEKIQ